MLKLLSNGVRSTISIHFRSLILYTTSTAPPNQPSHSIVSDSSSNKLSPSNSTPPILFFNQLNFSQTQINKLVSHTPNLLSITDIHQTLAPRIRAFQELGLSGPDLGALLASNPNVLSRRLETHIKPLIDSLRAILISDKNVVRAFQRGHFLMCSNVPKRIIPNWGVLRSFGLSQERIIRLVLTNPWNLVGRPELLEENMMYVEEVIGLPRESQMFIHGIDACTCVNKRLRESKFRVFEVYGWGEEDTMAMMRRLPHCLKLSEEKIRRGLDFFMKELGYEAEYIASRPKLLMYSLENRVFPRRALMKALAEKKRIKFGDMNLYTILCITDRRFLDNYVLPYKDELPGLCEAYTNKTLSDSSMAVVSKWPYCYKALEPC